MKKITFVMLIITGALFLGLGGFAKPLLADTANVKQTNRGIYLNIMASTKPQYYMLNALAGGKHNIEYMFDNEKQNKDYKTTEAAVENVSNMNLFFYSGGGYEPWVGNFLNQLNKGKVATVDLSRGIRSKYFMEDGKRVINPYYWTGPNEYEVMLYNATAALQEQDPANRSFYQDNYNKILKSIDEITNNFIKAKSASTNNYIFLTRNNDFEYLLSDLGINYQVVPKKMSFAQYINENNLEANKVIVIKNKDEKITPNGLKIITLQAYNQNISYIDLLKSNVNELSKLYPVINKKNVD